MERERRLIQATLDRLRLLRECGYADRALLAASSRAMRVVRGQTLVQRAQPAPGVMALAYGAVKLRVPKRCGERVVRLVRPGESFVESAALLGRASPFDAVALAESKIVAIPADAVLEVIGRDARVARAAMLLLAERHLRLLEEMHANAPRRGLQRLAVYLESVAAPGADGALRACLPGTRTLLASQLGMSKETLSRLLHRLSLRGVLRVSRREILIADRAGLSAAASPPD